MTQTIALFGATGTAGAATAAELRDAGHKVVAMARRDPQIRGVTFHPLNLPGLRAELDAIRADAVVSCLASRSGVPADAWAIDHDLNRQVLDAAGAAGVAQFILLSAICVQKPRLAFQHAKLAFEAELQASGLTWSIVRPTAFFKSLSGQADRLRAGKPFLIFGDGTLTACKPISDADLGRFITHCLTDPDKQNAILPIGGPGPALTARETGAALFAALGLPPAYRQVSPRLLSGIAAGLSLPGRFSQGIAAKAELARIGHYYATESMLLWDPIAQRYDAGATPAFGTETLPAFFEALAAGTATADRGAHAMF